jgi:fructokinase
MTKHKYFGGVEGGGTKFVCVVAASPDEVVEEERFATTTPGETIDRMIDFFASFIRDRQLSSICIASFGPVDLQKDSPTYGSITTTPKPGWAYTNVVKKIRDTFDIPIFFELDVNAAAFGEYFWVSENQSIDPLVYFTIGTGIGAGLIVNGKIIHGLMHPEAGHMQIPHDWQIDPYKGFCSYHGDCFEGLASGPAMKDRWRQSPEMFGDEHPAWELEANYIAHALVNVICLLSPKRIILGGGVMQQPNLITLVRNKVLNLLNNYIHSPDILEHIDNVIVPPFLGDRSGVLGAIALASLAQRYD